MSDSELRLLERRWRETGATDDEGRWLAARVRAGDLDGAWLEALAFFGHEAALLAGGKAPDPWDLDDANVWAAKLRPLGVPVVIRAAAAAVVLGAEAVARERPGSTGGGVWATLAAIEAWLTCPCKAHAQAADEAADAHEQDTIVVDDDGHEVEVDGPRWAVDAARHVARGVAVGTVSAATQALYQAARVLRPGVTRPAILAAIRDALVRVVHGQTGAEAPAAGGDPLLADPAVGRLVAAARTYLALVDVGVADAQALARAQAALVEAALGLPALARGADR